MSEMEDGKKARERAKAIAEQRRAERKNRKRKCVLCGVEESDKTPLGAHPGGCHDPIAAPGYVRRGVPGAPLGASGCGPSRAGRAWAARARTGYERQCGVPDRWAICTRKGGPNRSLAQRNDSARAHLRRFTACPD